MVFIDMIVYRIAKNKYIKDLSGKGAELYGGRWNNEGSPLLYTSAHLSLAVLELLANQVWKHVSKGYSYIELQIPDRLIVNKLDPSQLPIGWNLPRYHDSTIRTGDDWLKANAFLGLWVPSAVLPKESNLLLNPNHRNYKKIKIKEVAPIHIDHRILSVT